VSYPQNEEDLLSSDDETGSTTDSDTDSLFDDSDNETDATSDADTASLPAEIDSDTDDDASLFEDEVQRPSRALPCCSGKAQCAAAPATAVQSEDSETA
jgi:hypothetical protein